MTNYIVDCRYTRTTTPVGIPDFTLLLEAASTEDAIQRAEQSDCGDDFVAVGACDALGLVKILREQVRTLADIAREVALKSSTADDDIAELEALCLIHGITLPTYDEDDEAGIAKARRAIEAEELEAKYGDLEHPDYPEYMWRDDSASGLDYWPWVAERLAAADENDEVETRTGMISHRMF